MRSALSKAPIVIATPTPTELAVGMYSTMDSTMAFNGTTHDRSRSLVEMGIGKGGLISQKVYEDPHGLDVWRPEPSATMAIYLVNAKAGEEILGEQIPEPVASETYDGKWYGLDDEKLVGVQGAPVFVGLDSVFKAKETAIP